MEEESLSSQLNSFLSKMIGNVCQLPAQHCDSLICELICELNLEYIMRPTDPYVFKAICAQEGWHSSNRTVLARGSEYYAVPPSNPKEYHCIIVSGVITTPFWLSYRQSMRNCKTLPPPCVHRRGMN